MSLEEEPVLGQRHLPRPDRECAADRPLVGRLVTAGIWVRPGHRPHPERDRPADDGERLARRVDEPVPVGRDLRAAQAAIDGVEGVAVVPPLPQDPVDRPVDAGIRVRAVPGEQQSPSDRRAAACGMASGAKPPRQTIRARRAPVSRLRSQALDQRLRVDAIFGQDVDQLGPQAGIVAVDEHGPDQLRPRRARSGPGRAGPGLRPLEVALRRRLDHRQDHGEGPLAIRPGEAAEDSTGTGPGPRRPTIRPVPRAARSGPAGRRIREGARTPGPAVRSGSARHRSRATVHRARRLTG